MFLTDFVDVERPLAGVHGDLCRRADWLLPLAHAAIGDAEMVLVRLASVPMGVHPGVVTRIRTGECVRRDDVVFVPMRWETTSSFGTFPVLDGDLELSALDETRCRVSIQASYRPPLEDQGRLLGNVALHRVAESTVRAFLQRLAHCFEDPPGAGGAAAGAA